MLLTILTIIMEKSLDFEEFPLILKSGSYY